MAWSGAAPEPGASIRVLRWKQFIQAEFDSFVANSKKFSEQTGVKVRVDAENWDDIRPKVAVAANVGAGPDIIMGTNDDPFKFSDKLLDMTDLAEYLGAKYGGWYPIAANYGMLGKKWIALPQGATGGCLNYRISTMRAAGFEEFPKDIAGYLKLCQGLKKVGQAGGLRPRSRHRRRQRLGAMVPVGAWRQDGRRQQQCRHRFARDGRRPRIRQAALCDLYRRRALVDRSEQQQGVPRRPDQPDASTAYRSTRSPRTRPNRR